MLLLSWRRRAPPASIAPPDLCPGMQSCRLEASRLETLAALPLRASLRHALGVAAAKHGGAWEGAYRGLDPALAAQVEAAFRAE